jgi:hypothetical protein
MKRSVFAIVFVVIVIVIRIVFVVDVEDNTHLCDDCGDVELREIQNQQIGSHHTYVGKAFYSQRDTEQAGTF